MDHADIRLRCLRHPAKEEKRGHSSCPLLTTIAMMRKFFPKVLSEFLVIGLLIVLCLKTWANITAWGLIVSSISAQTGREPEYVLTAERLRAQRFFWMAMACQTLMLPCAVWFAGQKRQSGLRGTFIGYVNWLIGLGLVFLIDTVIIGSILIGELVLAR
jgi:hypothetical protein